MRTSSAARQFVTWAPLAAMLIVILPAVGAAQEPVKSFDQLNTRLKVGDTVWVTDARGREQKGTIRDLSTSSLMLLTGDESRAFPQAEVASVSHRKSRSVKVPVLIGLTLGGLIGAVSGVVFEPDSEMGNDAEAGAVIVGAAVGAGVGAGIGLAIGAVRPGEKVVVYRAPVSASGARLSFAPLITPRTKGVAVTYSF